MPPRGAVTLIVAFGPSKSPSFGTAVDHARDAGGREIRPNRWRVEFRLEPDESYTFGRALRLVELTHDWKGTEIEVDGEPERWPNVIVMLDCARGYIRTWGTCTFTYWSDIPPKCGVCPLYDRERAIREIRARHPERLPGPAAAAVPDYPPDWLEPTSE